MHIARLPTVRVSVAITRCQSHGGYVYLPTPLGYIYPADMPTPWISHSLGILTPPQVYILPTSISTSQIPIPRYLPPEGTWYQRYLHPKRNLVPEMPTLPKGGVGIPRDTRDTYPPSVNRLTDTCGNITFLQLLLRAVIRNLVCFRCLCEAVFESYSCMSDSVQFIPFI